MENEEMTNTVKPTFPLRKQNFLIIIIGIVVALLGYVLMTGGGSEDPNVFNEDEIFSFRRITLAPYMCILGYMIVLYGILKKPKA